VLKLKGVAAGAKIRGELRKFDGSPLFPERRASTIQYRLSDLEAQLYAAVTQYVRNEMHNLNALAGDDKRRNNVGFALQILQRRLVSSPAAIYHSLRRRRERLEARLAEERIIARTGVLQKAETFSSILDDDEDKDLDEAGGKELEDAEEEIVDRATAAQTIPELEAELAICRGTRTGWEQRFGRIHRIGQSEVCHLWNLVAADTREGEVYGRLQTHDPLRQLPGPGRFSLDKWVPSFAER
jgi:hypothetical protein